MPREPKIKVIKTRIPKTCRCPGCGIEQSFRKAGEYWKTVKDINLDGPFQFKIRIIRAKCSNPECSIRSFALPTPGIEKYSRSTKRLKVETIAGVVEDNSTAPRVRGKYF